MSEYLNSLLEMQEKYIPRSARLPYIPLTFVRGSGALLWDSDGNEYIDFLSSASSANVGHGREEIAGAAAEQMRLLAQYTAAYFPDRNMLELAKKLAELSGRENMMVTYSCTGSASIDGAIKLARGYTGRPKIISFSGSYHGSTYGAISVSKLNNDMRRKIGPLLPECETLEYPECLRCRYHRRPGECGLDCLESMKYAFEHYIPPDEVAAVIVEPVAGDAGLLVPPAKFFEGLEKLCREHGILIISDEINQGLGRTGKLFAMDNHGIECDMYVLGKSLGGGLPLGAVMGRREILDCLEAPAHLFTMSGNATCCAAGLKMLEIMEREELFNESVRKGEYLKRRLEEMAKEYDVIGEVRGIGLNVGVELVTDRTSMAKNYAAAAKICYACMKRGLLLTFVARSALRMQPPLCITDAELERAIEIVKSALEDYTAGRLGDDILREMQGW